MRLFLFFLLAVSAFSLFSQEEAIPIPEAIPNDASSEEEGVLKNHHEYLLKSSSGESKHIKVSRYLGDNNYEVFVPYKGQRGDGGIRRGLRQYNYNTNAPIVINLNQWGEARPWGQKWY